jgi:hypothetical protein
MLVVSVDSIDVFGPAPVILPWASLCCAIFNIRRIMPDKQRPYALPTASHSLATGYLGALARGVLLSSINN